MVAGAGRDDHERYAVPARDRGDQRLRAVPAGHADQVRTAGDRLLGELPAGRRRDAARWARCRARGNVDEVEPLGLAPTRLQGSSSAPGLRGGAGSRGGAIAAVVRRLPRAGRSDSERRRAPARPPGRRGSRRRARRRRTRPARRRTTAANSTGQPAPREHVPGRDDNPTSDTMLTSKTYPMAKAPPMSRKTTRAQRDQGDERGEPPGGTSVAGERCHPVGPGLRHVAPVCRTYSATASSSVGKKCAGSMVRVSS